MKRKMTAAQKKKLSIAMKRSYRMRKLKPGEKIVDVVIPNLRDGLATNPRKHGILSPIEEIHEDPLIPTVIIICVGDGSHQGFLLEGTCKLKKVNLEVITI